MMTYHLDEGALQALLDGELEAQAELAARGHLDTCASCTADLDQLRFSSAVFRGALTHLDVPVPVALPPSRAHGPRGFRRGGTLLPRAAAILLTVGAAGAAAAIPGSPLREWIETVLSPSARVATVATIDSTGATTLPAPIHEPFAEAGVGGVELRNGTVRFVITAPAPGVQVTVRLVEGARGGAYAVGGELPPEFRTTQGAVEIIGARGGELRIEIPRAASAATVQVNGTESVTLDGGTLRPVGPIVGETGSEVVFTTRD